MAEMFYGVDLDAKVITPLMVRDGLLQCFYEAHCMNSKEGKTEEENREDCRKIVERAFKDSGGDFEHPSKDSILEAMQKLMEFSREFRDPTIVQRHATEMLKLVWKINSD